jgi:hypothetical protein
MWLFVAVVAISSYILVGVYGTEYRSEESESDSDSDDEYQILNF